MTAGRNQPERGPLGPFFAPGWDLGRVTVTPAGRPLVMGIVNLTPDSFYRASRRQGPLAAVGYALDLAAQGADLLDLGAESSRPGADAIGAAEEQDRLLPVLTALRAETDLPLTVDTVRAETARLALDAGADAVNDISGGRDPDMFTVAANAGSGLILMHMQGTPADMQAAPAYTDVTAEVTDWLAARCTAAEAAGVAATRLAVDPGIGFGKTPAHNLTLMNRLDSVAGGRPLLLGASRKSFISAVTGAPVDDRLPGSLAALAAAWTRGATMVRVHDVAASVQFLAVLTAIASENP